MGGSSGDMSHLLGWTRNGREKEKFAGACIFVMKGWCNGGEGQFVGIRMVHVGAEDELRGAACEIRGMDCWG